jgi:hypothetical protein
VQEALGVLIRFYARLVAEDAGGPFDSALRLIEHTYDRYEPEEHIQPFIGLTSQIADYDLLAATSPSPYLEYAPRCRADLRTTARDLPARLGPGFASGIAA